MGEERWGQPHAAQQLEAGEPSQPTSNLELTFYLDLLSGADQAVLRGNSGCHFKVPNPFYFIQ